MKHIPSFLLCVLMPLFLTSCLDAEKVIKLNSDGSGTVEETVLMSKEAIKQMEEMVKGMQAGMPKSGDSKTEEPKPFNLLDEAKLKKDAAQMGEGVTLVSAKKVETPKAQGYKAIFSFTDINKLKIDQNPSSSAPSPGGEPMASPGDESKEPIGFKFKKGAPNELTITMPEPKLSKDEKGESAAGATAGKDDIDGAELAQMQQMFKDMKVLVAIEIKGAIVKTNATHRAGSRVTLVEMDFNKLLADPAKFKEFGRAKPESLEEAKKILKDIPGIKVETNREVNLQFQ